MSLDGLPLAEGEWTPTIGFVTPGDLSNSYASQEGRWWKIGNLMFISGFVSTTPTFTTASGNLLIEGLPVPHAPNVPRSTLVLRLSGPSVSWGGRTSEVGEITENTSYVRVIATGENLGGLIIGDTRVTSGQLFNIRISGFYPVN